MKNFFLIIVFLCNALFTSAQNAQQRDDRSGDLTVIVNGLKDDQGTVKIGLFNTAASWNDKEEKYMGAILPIKCRKATWIIRNVPYGQYAIKFFHDKNNDDELNMNGLGMPVEAYGFYKSGFSKFIPPNYEKAKFLFESPNRLIQIEN